MYRKAEAQDVERLLEYFSTDLKNCLYSYIDLKKYGIGNPNLTVYLDEDEEKRIKCSALKYYEGLQLFDGFGKMDAKATAELVEKLGSHIVSSTVEVIEKLFPLLENAYEMEKGYVTEMKKQPECEISGRVHQAEPEEYGEIAKLICTDPGVGGHYDPKELEEQLLTRYEEGFGRNYILKQDGEIIHHAATYAELEDLAVISGVITRADWRGKGIGTLAVRKLCRDLLQEGKKPCLFYYTKQAEGFYRKIGFEDGTGWAKLVLRKE